jgi:hypothetical protein
MLGEKKKPNNLSDNFTKTKKKLDHSFLKIPECLHQSKWACLSEIIQQSYLMPNPLSTKDRELCFNSVMILTNMVKHFGICKSLLHALYHWSASKHYTVMRAQFINIFIP